MINSVEKILNQLEKQPGWEKFRAYRQILQVWQDSVAKNTVNHTRPLYVSRQILWVATDSASRAQELSFQRYALLKKLNQQLPFTLKDIRFSASGFTTTNHVESKSEVLFTVSQQQKYLKPKSNLNTVENNHSASEQAKIAARRWLDAIEENIQSPALIPCPLCQSPTPSGEMERWSCCYICAAQKLAKDSKR